MASMEKITSMAESKKDSLRKAFEHSIRLLTLQWNDLEDYFDSTLTSIQQRFVDLQSREKKLDSAQSLIEERSKEIKSREKRLDSTQLLVEEQSTELDFKQETISERFGDIQSKEVELDFLRESIEGRMRELESKEKEFGVRCKELEAIEKSIGERCVEIELREKKYEERLKLLEMRERQCISDVHSKVKVEQGEFSGDDEAKHSSAASLRFTITMDGRCLQIFLNEHEGDHESMHGEIYTALRMSSDPAKLMLDAMQGFYPPHLKEEFDASVVRRSCSLLLGQLMRVSPRIRPWVREEAARLAVDWKGEMKVEGENSLEVLGFLQLVGAYRLLPDFDSDEFFKLFETIAQHREAPELCRVLGFADKVPDFIHVLILRRQNLAAIRFIHAFELVGKFPPVPILEDYLNYWKKIADKTCKSENLTRGEIETAKKTIAAALRAVIKCIEDHKLEIEYSPKNLEKCINILSEKANSGCITPANPKSPLTRQIGKNDGTPPMSSPKVQQQQQRTGNKRPRTAVSEDAPNASIGIASSTHLVHSPHRHPAVVPPFSPTCFP